MNKDLLTSVSNKIKKIIPTALPMLALPVIGVILIYSTCWLFGLPTGGWNMFRIPFTFSVFCSIYLAFLDKIL